MNNISIKNIYWMLAYAFRLINDNNIMKLSKEKFDNIYNLLATIVSIELSRIIKRGLNREYINIKDEISTVKGKININESIKPNIMIRNKIVCEFDEYSSNSYLNRIIKTTIFYLLKSNKITDNQLIINLKNKIIYFNDIDILNIKNINWKIIYNRNNSAYRIIINICYLILNGLLLSKDCNEIEYRDYFDPQKEYHLYEKFILEYYKYHYPNLNANVTQIEWNVNDKENNLIELLPKMITDITLYYEKRYLIIDAKYYNNMYQDHNDKITFKSNNLYQIYAYVKNLDKKNIGNVSGLLLYAKTDENDEKWALYKMDKNNIIVSNLDLSEDFKKVKEHLDLIANKFINKEI